MVAQWLERGQGGRVGRRAMCHAPPGPPQQERDAQRPPRSLGTPPAWQTPGRPNVEDPLKNILGFCQNSGEGPLKNILGFSHI